MTLEDVLLSLSQLKERLLSHLKLIYIKLEVADPSEPGDIDALDDSLPFELNPHLRSMWSAADSVQFEWFVKSEGIRAAGMDTRLAPNGQFTMLSPKEAAQEYQFLSDLAVDVDSAMPFVPLARMHPNGELIAVDHSADGEVVIVVLDLALTVYSLAPDLPTWFEQRMDSYFADSTLDSSVQPDPQLTAILGALKAKEFQWPPSKVGW